MSATEGPTATTREWQLAARPQGWPTTDDFRYVERDLPPLGPGEVRVRNAYLSVDPYMRGRMDDTPSYVPPYELDKAMEGGAVGRVAASRSDDLAEGDLVLHTLGWRDTAQGPAAAFRRIDPVPGVPESAYLHVLGMTGLTAYVGLLDVARMEPGDTVFISGAAGAVGSVAGQIARLKGASRVVGSAGSDAKVDLLTSKYGYDAAFNYKSGDVGALLRDAAPDGIDVYFDNVGGDHLEAALAAFNRGGRAAVCGMISAYNTEEPPAAPRNLSELLKKGLTLKGFTVGFYADRMKDFIAEAGQWLAEGSLVYDETVVDGVDNTLQAFLDMMRGANTGKMLVRVS
ncbi:NADP-dependent oxidoreductase [Nocardiopsis chromatogenes]|uniref:NADP-dependent oxidoreductase n=1 Tax=Nocardiopsis chromatogenes TaxID=280239 RepID=UPI00034B18D5|nr:NADP-dependent oxidoreductase [Nocardiopsis chromatogenes]